AVTAQTTVTSTSTYDVVANAPTLTLNPAGPAALAGVSVNPAAVTGPAGSTGTVTLGAAAPAGGAVVMLASNNPNAATVPISVTVDRKGVVEGMAVGPEAGTAGG